MTSVPKFHLQRVFDDGAQSAPEILPILDLPHDARLTRREFVGSGMTIASVLAALGSYTQEADAQPASGPKVPPPLSDAPKRASPGRPVHAHVGTVTALAVTADSLKLMSGGPDARVKLWSLPDAKLLRAMMEPTNAGITHVATTSDGRWAASASFAYRVKLWALPDGRPDKELPYHGHIAAMTTGADGMTLLVAGGKTVRFWSVPKVRLLKELAVADKDIESLAASADGKLLVAGQLGGKATLWALPEGRVLATLGEAKSEFREIAFAPDGSFLAAIDGGNHVALWAMPQGSLLRRSLYLRRGVSKIAVTPDSKRIVFGGADGTVGILSLDRFEKSFETLGEHESGISALAITPDGRILATGDASGVIALWDLVKGERIGFAFDPAASRNDGITYSVRDSVTGQLITYTLPCGSPIPAGATCVCNCVPGTYQPPVSTPSGGGGGRRICTCDKVCTCVPVRSDRDIKTDFAAIDVQRVLERLAALPITQWRYRDDDPSIRHIGPMAQDFAAAFGVGDDERSIHPVDAHGIAIASIQALHRALGEALEELKAQRAKIEELAGELQQLRTGSR